MVVAALGSLLASTLLLVLCSFGEWCEEMQTSEKGDGAEGRRMPVSVPVFPSGILASKE